MHNLGVMIYFTPLAWRFQVEHDKETNALHIDIGPFGIAFGLVW